MTLLQFCFSIIEIRFFPYRILNPANRQHEHRGDTRTMTCLVGKRKHTSPFVKVASPCFPFFLSYMWNISLKKMILETVLFVKYSSASIVGTLGLSRINERMVFICIIVTQHLTCIKLFVNLMYKFALWI